MKHFVSTFILCFFGFLFKQTRAIASWKSCSAHSDCQATGEYCVGNTFDVCFPCASFDSYGESLDGSKPAWCDGYSENVTITSSSVLIFSRQAGFNNNVSKCASFDLCTKDCRKEYSVARDDRFINLTSNFVDTSDCVCDKLVFTGPYLPTDNIFDDFSTTTTNIGRDWDTVTLDQYSASGLDITMFWEDGLQHMECSWEYTFSSSPPPSPPSTATPTGPLSSSTATLTGLFGLLSASVVAFVLL